MKNRKPARLNVETLEGRLQPAGNLLASLSGAGDLRVMGDNLQNSVQVSLGVDGGGNPAVIVTGQPDLNGVATTVNGNAAAATFTLPAGGLRNIMINTKNAVGGDVVVMDNVVQSGNLSVYGGTGSDIFALTDLTVGKNAFINAKAGNNTVSLLGTPNGSVVNPQATTAIGKNLSIFGSEGNDNLAAGGVTVGGNLKMGAGNGNNFVGVNDIVVNGITGIITRKGNDIVDVGMIALNGDNLHDTSFGNFFTGRLAISTAEGDDVVAVLDGRFNNELIALLGDGNDRFSEGSNAFALGQFTAMKRSRAGKGNDTILTDLNNLNAEQLALTQFEVVNDGSDQLIVNAINPRLDAAFRVFFESFGINIDGDSEDQVAEAEDLGVVPAVGEILRAGSITFRDVDLFQVTIPANTFVRIDVDLENSGLDSRLRLFALDGTELTSSDNNVGSGPEFSGLESTIDIANPTGADQTLVFGVSAAENANYNANDGKGDVPGSIGNYTVVVSQIAAQDQISEAVVLGDPVNDAKTFNGNIVVGTDVQMFSFDGTREDFYRIDIDSAQLDSFIRVFDAAGNELASNDNGFNPADEVASNESFLLFKLPADGTFFVGVSGSGNANYNAIDGSGDQVGDTGEYQLIITNDADGQIDNALLLPDPSLGNPIIGQQDNVGGRGVKMFQINLANPATTMTIDLDSLGLADSVLRVFDVNGNELAINDDGTAPGEAGSGDSFLQFNLNGATQLFIGVSSFNNQTYNAVDGTGDQGTGNNGFGGEVGGLFALDISVV